MMLYLQKEVLKTKMGIGFLLRSHGQSCREAGANPSSYWVECGVTLFKSIKTSNVHCLSWVKTPSTCRFCVQPHGAAYFKNPPCSACLSEWTPWGQARPNTHTPTRLHESDVKLLIIEEETEVRPSRCRGNREDAAIFNKTHHQETRPTMERQDPHRAEVWIKIIFRCHRSPWAWNWLHLKSER